MRLEDARQPVTSVRPTRNGQWEVIQTTKGEDAEWQREWVAWWESAGKDLQAQHPDWWREDKAPSKLPSMVRAG